MSDPLPPVALPPSETTAPRAPRIHCEFCHCSLAPNGDVMSMSEQARTYRDQAETITRLSEARAAALATIDTRDRELGELRTQLAQAQAPVAPAPAGRGW